MLRFLPVQRPSLSLADHFRWTRRRSILRGSGVGVSHLVSDLFCAYARFFAHISHLLLPTFADQVRFLITWEAVEHEGPYVFHRPLAFLGPS
jgi:hypothetical protein